MSYVVAPMPYHFFMDADGAPYAGGKLYTYEAGTTTELATYSDSDGTANANPIVLDSAGRATIFLGPASYKFVLKDSSDNTIWTIDGVSAPAAFDVGLAVDGTAGAALSDGDFCYLSDGTGSLTAGSWYKCDSDTSYSSANAPIVGTAQGDIASGASGSFLIGGRHTGESGLTIGSVYYVSSTAGAITATKPSNARVVGVADSATSLIMLQPDISTGLTRYEDSATTATGNVGTGEDTLYTHSIAAGKIATNGQTVKGIAWGLDANNANAKTVKLHLDDGTNDNTALTVTMPVSEQTKWQLTFTVIRKSSTEYHCTALLVGGPADSASTVSVGNVTSTGTLVWANAVEIRVTGEATANNDIYVVGALTEISTL